MSKIFNRMDKILLITTLFMFLFGLFMIFDASSMKSFFETGHDTYYFSKQLAIIVISFFLSGIIFLNILLPFCKCFLNQVQILRLTLLQDRILHIHHLLQYEELVLELFQQVLHKLHCLNRQ